MQGSLRRAIIPPFLYFTVRDWEARRDAILHAIGARLSCDYVAVRSSTRDEDGAQFSYAGHYRTRLEVRNRPRPLAIAIDEVRASFHGNPDDQVLVQEMVRGAAMSGVVLSHDPETGAPYRIIEYDDRSARTDRVTRGVALPATAVVHHDASLRSVADVRLRRVVAMTREVERAAAHPAVEIEFAVRRDGAVVLLQARALTSARPPSGAAQRIAAALARLASVVSARSRPHPTLAGRRTILGQMPDWNPAELIGACPAPLAASLFRTLITDDVWQRARAAMGYRRTRGEPLMILLAGRPYVDARVSFNSFLPHGLAPRIEGRLVDAWIERLHDHPELHDKIEFEIVQTSIDFSFARAHRARYGGLLRPDDLARYGEALRRVTAAAVTCAPAGSLRRALAASDRLDRLPAPPIPRDRMAALRRGFRLLTYCRRYGTLPFAIVARHAFIAEAFLRSAVERGAWTAARLDAFRRSLTTVASELTRDFAAVSAGAGPWSAFLERYGHLRPGTFDVTSLRYDERHDLWRKTHDDPPARLPAREAFVPTCRELRAFGRLIAEAGLRCSAEDLLRHATTAIVGRERTKFAFSRRLSDALQCLVVWAAHLDLTREDLSQLTLDDLDPAAHPCGQTPTASFRDLIDARRTRSAELRALRLSPLIRSPRDLYVLPHCPAVPTFVTSRNVTAAPLRVDGGLRDPASVPRRIVCIESADPGFDWIFAYRIAGLVTRFGGGNSHMAIRCFELGVPAAIGVGQGLFTRVVDAASVELRCGERVVRPVGPERATPSAAAAAVASAEGR